MYKTLFLQIILFSSLPVFLLAEPNTKQDKKTVVFDQVVAIVYQNEAPDLGSKDDVDDTPEIITKQDVERAGFDGKEHTVASHVIDKESILKAKSLKIAMSDEDVDRYLEKANMNEEQQAVLAERWFYDGISEFKAALKDMYVANMSLSYDVEANMIISEADIQAYYDKNPVWLEAEYEIQTSFLHANVNNKTKLHEKLEKFVQTGKGLKVEWEEAVVIKISEISSQNQFLNEMKVGQIYFKPVLDGFDLFKMTVIRPRRLQPLAQRRMSIINDIRQVRYPKVVEQVKQDLHAKSSVYYPVQY